MFRSRWFIAVVSFVALGGCAIATPFQGPGYDGRDSAAAEGPDKLIVAVTNGVLNGDSDARSRFWDHVAKVERSLSERQGFVGHSKRKEIFGNEVWTLTVWRDESSLNAFVQSDTHQTAIREAFGAFETARFARFEISRREMPVTWDRALAALEKANRTYDSGDNQIVRTP